MQSNLVNHKDTGSANEMDIVNIGSKETRLEFTGNWFIDAGILGFVNLMEEVYGWKLEELKEKIKDDPDKVYYGYFPFAYLFYHSKIRSFYGVLYDKQKGLVTKIIDRKNKIRKEKNSKKIEKLSKEIDSINVEIRKLKIALEDEKSQLKTNLDGQTLEAFARGNFKKSQLKTNLDVILSDLTKNNTDVLKDKKLIKDFKIEGQQFAKNFALLNPSKNNKFKKDFLKSYLYIYYLLKEDVDKLKELKKGGKKQKDIEITYEVRPDFVVNPFLVPEDVFPNVLYTKPLTLNQIKKIVPDIPIYLIILSFQNSFLSFYRVRGRYSMFYTNNLKISYSINKRIITKIEIAKDKPQSLFRITLSSIIDELVEEKSKFSLENMYLIEYSSIGKDQKLKGVEYISIPKLQASIILDDVIRDALNKNVQGSTKAYAVWLLEEFINNKSLYPLVSQHVWLGISGVLKKNNGYVSKTASLYALAIDANIKQFNKNNTNKLFSDDFFRSYEWLLDAIKEDYKIMFRASYTNIVELFKDSEDRKKLVYPLFSAVENHNKKEFLYVIIKNLLGKKDTDKVSHINKYLFEKILNNDICWENYALSLIVNIADN